MIVRTRRTSPVIPRSSPLAVLDEDRLEDVGRVLERVDGFLEPLVDVLPAHDLDRVLLRVEKAGHGVSEQAIALVLELAKLDEVPARIPEPLEQLHGRRELLRRAQ